MSNFNYMDNVPVKISENYRPLPVVYQLPQAIAHKLALPVEHYQTAPQYQYDFQLERILLKKLPEWRQVRQREKEARRERIQNRDQQKQRLYEVKQKELLGAVSYPSTEDLSSCSSDEGEGKGEGKAVGKTAPSNEITQVVNSQVGVNNFHNILQPTILTPSASSPATTNGGYMPPLLAGSFNYQDFEGSSSPFDEIELKTINDLDILAQVLHNTQMKDQADKLEDDECTEKSADSPEIEANRKEAVDVKDIPKTRTSADIISSHLICNNETYTPTPHMQQPPFQPTNCEDNFQSYQLEPIARDYQTNSVPDILNVLKEETRKSEFANRIRNHKEEVLVEEDKETQSLNKMPFKNNTTVESPLSTIYYSQLDETSKQMVENISTMGFSLEQVSRIALLYGADDKKIIEHLICLNELSVLGFAEENVSNALLKCENNKEKALELLIS